MTSEWIVAEASLTAQFATIRPSITTWFRLEALPTSPHLGPSLAAPIADPLWMLNRQWGFGEFRGEDAGSPIDIRLAGESAKLSRYHPGLPGQGASTTAIDYAHLTTPLEVAVEHEPAEDQVRLAGFTGQQAVRALISAEASHAVPTLRNKFGLKFEKPPDPAADRAGAEWAAIVDRRAVDGNALAKKLSALVDIDRQLTDLPEGLGDGTPAQRARVKTALEGWLDWYREFLSLPDPGSISPWTNRRQEYALTLSATATDGPLVLRADEYTDGRLDWWTFRLGSEPDLGSPTEAEPSDGVIIPSMLPAAARYPGMPADRFWEFEDGEVNLGSLDAGPGDLERILLVEFGLVYGNDWWVVPVELPVGSLFKVTSLRVLDTFGVETNVGPSRNSSGPAWEMFELGQTGAHSKRLEDWFFLPPTLAQRLEGDPVEKVSFARDEMANLVWAVEHLTPGTSGEPIERSLEAARDVVHQQIEGDVGEAQLVYRLMTQVPINWIPFAPVAVGGAPGTPSYDLEFERRALVRTRADGTSDPRVHPKGGLLRSNPAVDVGVEPPLRIPEEEIRRDGIVVTRGFQYARWFGGKSMLWMGRAKHTGRGEGSSGLRFDTADPPAV